MIAMVDSASLSLAQSAASQTSLDLRTTPTLWAPTLAKR